MAGARGTWLAGSVVGRQVLDGGKCLVQLGQLVANRRLFAQRVGLDQTVDLVRERLDLVDSLIKAWRRFARRVASACARPIQTATFRIRLRHAGDYEVRSGRRLVHF